MKKILLLFCLSLIIGLQYSFAQTDSKTDKEKIQTDDNNWFPPTRSIVYPPELYQNGNIIYINSSITLQDLQITIKDLSGNTLYSATTTVYGNIEYSFNLNIETSEYMIELTHGNQYLYGYFFLE